MTPDAKREPTALELEIAAEIVVPADGQHDSAAEFTLHSLRRDLARTLTLSDEESARLSTLDPDTRNSLLGSLRDTYWHMSAFVAFEPVAAGAVTMELRSKLAQLSAGVDS